MNNEKENKLREVASKHLQDNAITSHCFKAQELEYNLTIEAMISFAKSQEVAEYYRPDVNVEKLRNEFKEWKRKIWTSDPPIQLPSSDEQFDWIISHLHGGIKI